MASSHAAIALWFPLHYARNSSAKFMMDIKAPRSPFLWPGISRGLQKLVRSVPNFAKPKSRERSLWLHLRYRCYPGRGFATELFQWKQETFLFIIDYYFRFIEIAWLNSLTTSEVITRTKSFFAPHRIPETMISNNEPQYASEKYKKLAKNTSSNM